MRTVSSRQKLIFVAPPNVGALLDIMDKIFGLYLQLPVIQDAGGQPIYIDDAANIPAVVVTLSI